MPDGGFKAVQVNPDQGYGHQGLQRRADHVVQVEFGLAETQVVERFKNMGATSVGSSPEEFAALIKRETDLWRSVISDRKLVLE